MYFKFSPGKPWLDNAGKRIQAHGGSVIYSDGKFWWYGENKEGITGTATGTRCTFWHHGVKLYSSSDLYNWCNEGFAVEESTDASSPFYPRYIMDRPHVIFNEKSGNYVLWAKTADVDFSKAYFSVCVGKSLKNMTFIGKVYPAPFNAGDFDLFTENGKGYIVFENPHKRMVLYELNDDFTGLSDKFSTHLNYGCPPFVREAPAVFKKDGRIYLISSGTTGYFPNPSLIHDITALHGKWRNLGDACVGDKNSNSFSAQFSSVFKHPHKKDLYIALGDRWLTDLPQDMTNVCDVFYDIFSKRKDKKYSPKDLEGLTAENTSLATYVWLPVTFGKNGKPQIRWEDEWRIN